MVTWYAAAQPSLLPLPSYLRPDISLEDMP
jgi:hypothetical protein